MLAATIPSLQSLAGRWPLGDPPETVAPEVSKMAETKTDDTEAVQVDSFMNESRLLPRGENMIMAECDEKGRLQLGLALRRRYGSRFVVVEAPDELVLLPVPHGPVKDLEELGKPLEYLPRDEIKRIIDRRARQEVGF